MTFLFLSVISHNKRYLDVDTEKEPESCQARMERNEQMKVAIFSL